MTWFPSFSKGEVDHVYPWWGDFLLYRNNKWSVDRPRGYNADVRIGNQVIIYGLGASYECGLLTASKFIDKKLAYASGINCGVNETTGRTPVDTHVHENKRSIFHFFDRNITVIIDRLHITTPSTSKFVPGTQAIINANPKIQTLWHSQTITPIVTEEFEIIGDSKIVPHYSCNISIVDEQDITGLFATEKKWHARVVPKEVKDFQILVTTIGDNASVIIENSYYHKIRLHKDGFKDICIISSNTPGPKLVTSLQYNRWGGATISHDANKLNLVLEAHKINPDVSYIKDADIYIETDNDLLVKAGTDEIPPESNDKIVLINEIRAKLDQLEILVK